MSSFLDSRPICWTELLLQVKCIHLKCRSQCLPLFFPLVLSTTGKENNVSHVVVTLANPFSSPLQVTKISSDVTAFGIALGTINQDTSFTSSPHSTTKSPELNLDMNFDPASLFTVTRALAIQAGEDTSAFDSIVELGGFQFLPTTQSGSSQTKRQGNQFTSV